jgi:hypothetical protein
LDAQIQCPHARRIPLTWILLLDLLVGALLSLAWARPTVAITQPGHNPRHFVILLDVSSSMRAADGGFSQPATRSGSGTRFAEAKMVAEALLREAAPQDAVTLLTFGQQARIIADSRRPSTTGLPKVARQIDLTQLSDRLEQARVGETGHGLLEALAMGQAALDPRLPAEFHVITDGAFPLPDPGAIERFAYPLRWHWVGGAADNQAVLELNATPLAGNRLQVFARLANFGSQDVTREAVLAVDGRVVEQASLYLPAGSSVPHVWQISPGQISPEAGQPAGSVAVSLSGNAISGADALSEDDSAVIGLQPGGRVRVAFVAGAEASGATATKDPAGFSDAASAPIRQALQSIADVDVHVIAPGDYAAALAGQRAKDDQGPYDLTIFRNFLPTASTERSSAGAEGRAERSSGAVSAAWPPGQVLVIDPPPDSGTGGALLVGGPGREIPPGSLTQAADASPLVAGIDFSGVRWARALTLAVAPPGFTTLLQANGTPLLLQGQVVGPSGERSQVTVLLADLARGNFARHPAFPILMANLVELARQAPLPAGFETGEVLPLPAPGSYRAIQITPPQGSPVDLGSSWPETWADTLEPGLYQFTLTAVDGSLTRFSAGARAGDVVESDLTPRGWVQSIAGAGSAAAAAPEQQMEPLDLSAWLLGAAVLIFMLEAVLAWRR